MMGKGRRGAMCATFGPHPRVVQGEGEGETTAAVARRSASLVQRIEG
jgi:hypothetical protein